jgi:hypothetical protein
MCNHESNDISTTVMLVYPVAKLRSRSWLLARAMWQFQGGSVVEVARWPGANSHSTNWCIGSGAAESHHIKAEGHEEENEMGCDDILHDPYKIRETIIRETITIHPPAHPFVST